MLTYHAKFLYEYRKMMQQEIERIKEYLTVAYMNEGFDFSAYRHQVGKVEGLRKALELCDDVESDLNTKE